MASVDSPRGLVLARKNGSGSNSTGVTMIPVGDNYKPNSSFSSIAYKHVYRRSYSYF